MNFSVQDSEKFIRFIERICSRCLWCFAWMIFVMIDKMDEKKANEINLALSLHFHFFKREREKKGSNFDSMILLRIIRMIVIKNLDDDKYSHYLEQSEDFHFRIEASQQLRNKTKALIATGVLFLLSFLLVRRQQTQKKKINILVRETDRIDFFFLKFP